MAQHPGYCLVAYMYMAVNTYGKAHFIASFASARSWAGHTVRYSVIEIDFCRMKDSLVDPTGT